MECLVSHIQNFSLGFVGWWATLARQKFVDVWRVKPPTNKALPPNVRAQLCSSSPA
jgi:hypothetical protein